MSAIGGVYKQINKYLQQAKKLDKIEPVIAYYCRKTHIHHTALHPPISSPAHFKWAAVHFVFARAVGRFYAALYGMRIRQTKADTEVVTALVQWCEEVRGRPSTQLVAAHRTAHHLA